MLEANEVLVSKEWDLVFLAQEAQFVYPYATRTDPATGDVIIKFHPNDYDRITTAVDEYPVSYLPTAKSTAKNKVAEIGRSKVTYFPFNGNRFPLDFTTECRLDALCRYFDRNAEREFINWDTTGAGDFVQLTREIGYGLFDAASQHMQAVFDKRKALTDLINAAEDINDPVFDQLQDNWPGDEESE